MNVYFKEWQIQLFFGLGLHLSIVHPICILQEPNTWKHVLLNGRQYHTHACFISSKTQPGNMQNWKITKFRCIKVENW
jgi:hypothetical protein